MSPMKDSYWKVFWVMTLPLLPAGWIYIYFAFGEGWGYRHISAFIVYVLGHVISYGVVQGVDRIRLRMRGDSVRLPERKKLMRRVIYSGMFLSIIRFTVIPLFNLEKETSYMKVQHTIYSPVYCFAATLFLGLYLLLELRRATPLSCKGLSCPSDEPHSSRGVNRSG